MVMASLADGFVGVPQVRIQVSLYILRFVLFETRDVTDNVRACSSLGLRSSLENLPQGTKNFPALSSTREPSG